MKMTEPAEDGGVDVTVSRLSLKKDGTILIAKVSTAKNVANQGGGPSENVDAALAFQYQAFTTVAKHDT